jgi:hypothetical protein
MIPLKKALLAAFARSRVEATLRRDNRDGISLQCFAARAAPTNQAKKLCVT